MLKCIRWFLLGIAALSASGCASDCNLFSSNNSLACDAKLLATAAVGMVTVVPVAIVSDAINNAKDKREAVKREKTIRAGLAQNDPEIIKECLLECEFIRVFEGAVNTELYQDAAKRFLAGAVSNTPEQQGYTVIAHHALAWDYQNKDELQTINHEHFNRAYRLLQQPETHEQLQAIQRSLSYENFIIRMTAMKFAMESTDDTDTAQAIFKQCPQTVSPMLNYDVDSYTLFSLCKDAYYYRFSEKAPQQLIMEWYNYKNKIKTEHVNLI